MERNDTMLVCSWTGTTELLDCLVASVQIHTIHGDPPQDPPDPKPVPHKSQPTPHLPPARNPTPDAGASSPPAMAYGQSSHHGMHKTQRMALLVIATLLQQPQYGLLMHLIRRGEGGKDVGLCQSLLEMVDSVTRGQPGTTNLFQEQEREKQSGGKWQLKKHGAVHILYGGWVCDPGPLLRSTTMLALQSATMVTCHPLAVTVA